MNRNHLALFHAVAKAGGISRGAEMLRVSQPAVSKQLKEFEDSLGVRLLERLPRGSSLTEGGKILAQYAQRMASLEEEARRAMDEFRGLKRGRLAVGASKTIGAYLLPQLFGEFHLRHPEIELHLEIANTQTIQQQLMDGLVEIGLTEGLMEAEHFDSTVFYEDELVAIARRGHPILKKKQVTISDLSREPFILREEGSGTRAVVEQALASRGIKVKSVLALSNPEAIKNAVIAGVGIALVSRLAIRCELQFGAVEIIPVKDLSIRRPFHLQKLQGKSQSPAVVEFLKNLDLWKSEPKITQ